MAVCLGLEPQCAGGRVGLSGRVLDHRGPSALAPIALSPHDLRIGVPAGVGSPCARIDIGYWTDWGRRLHMASLGLRCGLVDVPTRYRSPCVVGHLLDIGNALGLFTSSTYWAVDRVLGCEASMV